MATALRIISLLQSLTLDNQDSTKAENIIHDVNNRNILQAHLAGCGNNKHLFCYNSHISLEKLRQTSLSYHSFKNLFWVTVPNNI